MRLRLEEAELRALTQALIIEDLQQTRIARLVALPRELQARLRGIPRIRLCGDELRIVVERIEQIGDLAEGIEYYLLVARGTRV